MNPGLSCPHCGNTLSQVEDTRKPLFESMGGVIRRRRRCFGCDRRFFTIETVEALKPDSEKQA